MVPKKRARRLGWTQRLSQELRELAQAACISVVGLDSSYISSLVELRWEKSCLISAGGLGRLGFCREPWRDSILDVMAVACAGVLSMHDY